MTEDLREHFLTIAEDLADTAYRESEGIADPQTLALLSIARSLLVIAWTAGESS